MLAAVVAEVIGARVEIFTENGCPLAGAVLTRIVRRAHVVVVAARGVQGVLTPQGLVADVVRARILIVAVALFTEGSGYIRRVRPGVCVDVVCVEAVVIAAIDVF